MNFIELILICTYKSRDSVNYWLFKMRNSIIGSEVNAGNVEDGKEKSQCFGLSHLALNRCTVKNIKQSIGLDLKMHWKTEQTLSITFQLIYPLFAIWFSARYWFYTHRRCLKWKKKKHAEYTTRLNALSKDILRDENARDVCSKTKSISKVHMHNVNT